MKKFDFFVDFLKNFDVKCSKKWDKWAQKVKIMGKCVGSVCKRLRNRAKSKERLENLIKIGAKDGWKGLGWDGLEILFYTFRNPVWGFGIGV